MLIHNETVPCSQVAMRSTKQFKALLVILNQINTFRKCLLHFVVINEYQILP